MSTQVGESAWANTWREVEDRIRTDAATMWKTAGTPRRADVEAIARKHQVPFRIVWSAAVSLMNGNPIRRPAQPTDWPTNPILLPKPGPDPKPQLTCEECGRIFNGRQALSVHRTRKHTDPGVASVSSTPAPDTGTDVAEVTPSPAPEPAAQAEQGRSAVAPSAGDGGPPSPPSPAAGDETEPEPEPAGWPPAVLGKMLDPIAPYLAADQPDDVQQAAMAASAAITLLHDTVLAHDKRAQLQARRAQLAAELAAIDAQLDEQVAA